MKKINVFKASLLQALGLISYISLVATIFWKGSSWFGNINNYFGPLLMLSLLSVSVLVCGLVTLSYPFILWQKEKKPKLALKVVMYTAFWIVGFILLGFTYLAFFRG